MTWRSSRRIRARAEFCSSRENSLLICFSACSTRRTSRDSAEVFAIEGELGDDLLNTFRERAAGLGMLITQLRDETSQRLGLVVEGELLQDAVTLLSERLRNCRVNRAGFPGGRFV